MKALVALIMALAAQTNSGPPAPPSRDSLTAVPAELQLALQKHVIDATHSPEDRLKKLVEFVFDENLLGIQYQPDATQTITEIFNSRKVNCLSSTMLIVALARHDGFKAYGQLVSEHTSWSTNGEIVFQSKHSTAIIEVGDKRYAVDVDARQNVALGASHAVSDEEIHAIYYSNRAMELLSSGDTTSAKEWMNTALRHYPDNPGLLNNAGVISLRAGQLDNAETMFRQAVRADPHETSALSNLIALYERRGETSQAKLWRTRAERILRKNPYYQYSLGQNHEQAGSYQLALKHFQRAARLNPEEHLFQFGLARAHMHLGNLHKADLSLTKAHELSSGELQSRYANKLATLRRAGH